MRILFTNNTLDKPAGTELSVFDYTRLLKKRGHELAAFSHQQGELAERLHAIGVSVLDKPSDCPWQPDIIHGHHQWETSLAALHFPTTPVISFHRGTIPWQEAPCLAPNVRRWIAVDVACQRSLIDQFHCPPEQVQVILNGVDLKKFPQRPSLPKTLTKVLVFSNYAKEGNFLTDIRTACEQNRINCRAVGSGVGEVLSDPYPALCESDLVFAKGKAALEALVTGCAVVVCDAEGLGPLIRPDNFSAMRRLSFAYEAMQDDITVENVINRLQAWDAESASAASQLARTSASLEQTVDQLESLYQEVTAKWQSSPSPDFQKTAAWASHFFTQHSTAYKLGRELQQQWLIEGDSKAPISAKEETVEKHRIMYAFREQKKRVTQLQDRINTRDEKIATLKEQLQQAKKSAKKKWWQKK